MDLNLDIFCEQRNYLKTREINERRGNGFHLFPGVIKAKVKPTETGVVMLMEVMPFEFCGERKVAGHPALGLSRDQQHEDTD